MRLCGVGNMIRRMSNNPTKLQSSTHQLTQSVDDEAVRAELLRLKRDHDDLQIVLQNALDHGDVMQQQLAERNAALTREVGERSRIEAQLKSLVATLRDKCSEYEVLVDILAQHGDALEDSRSKEMEVLEKEVLTDALTQWPNRRALDQKLRFHWNEAMRDGTPLSIIMGDIDHFKLYNDSLGHSAGDECLRRVAKALLAATRRPGDMVARYGGEEFCLVLPHTNSAGAQTVATSLLASMAGAALAHPKSSYPHVTLSLGIATFLKVGSSIFNAEQLLKQADAALYEAKDSGRNRFIVFKAEA